MPPLDFISSGRCDAGPTVQHIYRYIYVWFIAIFFCIFFIVVQKRSKHCPGCCFGRPGLPVPMDFLVSPRNRFVYSLLFGIMGYSLVTSRGNPDVSLSGTTTYVSIFNEILWLPSFNVATLMMKYFPLFTAVEFQHRRIGYVTGLIYSIIWYLFECVHRFLVYRCYAATYGNSYKAKITVTVLQDAPLVIMAFIVVVWFAYMTAFHCFWKPFHKRESFPELGDLDDPCKGIRHYHLDHVRNLLKSEIKGTQKQKTVIHRVVRYFFPFKRNYKLPLPLLGSITAMVMIVYQISVSIFVVSLTILIQSSKNYKNNSIQLLLDQQNLTAIEKALATVAQRAIFIGVPTMMVLAPIFSLLLSVFLLIHMISSISKTIKEVAKHGFVGRLPPRYLRISAYWKYLGAQIGLFFVAWAFYFVIFLVTGIALMIIILLLAASSTRSYATPVFVTIGIPLVWSQLILVGQSLVSKFVFLGDRKDDSKFIPVQHRRLYNLFGFVLFFYNGFAGFVGGVIRIILNMVFGFLLLFRLDIQFLPSHLWWWDFGHKSYLGFIYMNYCYNNAVMHVFSHLLEKSVVRQNSLEQEANVERVELVGADVIAKSQNRGARNRWFVAYTLIRNPSLQKYTANNIALLVKEKKLQEDKVFILEHAIKNVKKDEERLEQKKKKEEKLEEEEETLAMEEMIGVEIKPDGKSGVTEENVEEKDEALPLYPSIHGTKEETNSEAVQFHGEN